MERRFFYPGSVETRYPSDVVFQTTDLEDRSLPYRELRANDHGSFQHPQKVTSDVYSAQPMVRGHSAVPWWTSSGLGLRPVDGVSRSRNLTRDEKLESKLSRYYTEDGLVRDSGLPADNNTKLIKKTTEPQLWRKICDPKRAILTEVNGKLIWRETNDDYDKSQTITQTVEVQQPSRLRSSIPVGRTPYMVYT